MTNWWIDPYGNSSYTGDSPTLTLSGTDGQTYGTTKFTSATGGFTGMENRYIRIVSTMKKIVAVVSDTEVTLDSTYTAGTNRTFYIGGCQTAPSNIPAAYCAAGDVFKVPKTPDCDAVSAGNLTYTLHDAAVSFTPGRVKVVDQCEAGWVAADASVTLTQSTAYVSEGTYTTRAAILSAFTGGKVCYKDFGQGNELDLSAYQGLSFIMQVGSGTAQTAAMGWRVCLCSDATGDTIIEDLTIPFPATMPNTSAFRIPITVYKGTGNLPAFVRSIAFYVTNDPTTPTIYWDNIVAVKAISDADHLCHRCILSQGSDMVGINDWWAILNFSSDAGLVLGGEFYNGTSGAVASYRREASPAAPMAISAEYGVPGTVCEFSGGWNTSTGLKDGASVFFGWNNYYLVNLSSGMDYWKIKDFMMLCNGGQCIACVGGRGNEMENIVCASTYNASGYGVFGDFSSSTADVPSEIKLKGIRVTSHQNYVTSSVGDPTSTTRQVLRLELEDFRALSTKGVNLGCIHQLKGKDVTVSNCVGTTADRCLQIYRVAWDCEINGLTVKDNPLYGMAFGQQASNFRVTNLLSSGNGTAALSVRNADVRLLSASIAETTPFADFSPAGRVASIKHGGALETHIIQDYWGTITSDVSVRHTASGIAWKLSPTNAALRPLRFRIGEVALGAGVTYTMGLYMRRDDTGLSGRFFTPGGQIGGAPAEISASITANANIWELVTWTITPTETGTIDLWVEASGGTTYSLYADDLSIS